MEFRCEEKYLCMPSMLAALRHRLTPLMRLDQHQESRSAYEVRSLYFDDVQDSACEDTYAGINERRKFRLRLYNGDASRIRLEIKSKRNGFVRKDTCAITRNQCIQLIRGEPLRFFPSDPPPLQVWNLQMRTCLLRPRIIVSYRRCAFVEPTGNVRVTFDEDLCYAPIPSHFLESQLPMLPVARAYRHLLEVKYDQLLPDVLANAIQLEHLCKTAFSKYTICRDTNIL